MILNSDASPAPPAGDWFGQPRGLTILFLTEMWEKFSFYGMRALLVLYMTKQLRLAQQDASWIYGIYAASVYFTPILGGVIADRWIGRRAAVVIGALTMTLGHFLMASEDLFYVALATIAVGNGFFLPSLASQIDGLYETADPRRKSAYNVYYVGVNLGAFAAPLMIGTVGEIYGFHWGFSIAGLGMVVALATYLAGARHLPTQGPMRRAADTAPPPPDERDWGRRLTLLICIAGAVVVLRGAYEQLGNTLALWADARVDRAVSPGAVIPVTWFQALNPLIVFMATPVLVGFWTHQARMGREPSSGIKMAWGAVLIGAAFLLIALAGGLADARGGKASWIWLTVFIGVLTLGELFLLPVGLGLFGRLAPRRLSATTIAVWFSAGFLGNLLAGWLGGFWSALSQGVFFLIMGGVALVSALMFLGLARPIRALERES